MNILKKFSSLFSKPSQSPAPVLLKLNLGCGYDKRDGFINIDMDETPEPDILSDVSHLHMIATGSCEHILANDILEHLNRHKIPNTLKEWNRVLSISGTLEMTVPSLVDAVAMLAEKGEDDINFQKTMLQNIFGTQHYPGDFHHYSFTEQILRSLFSETGFTVQSLTVKDGWLFHVVAEKFEHQPIDAIYEIEDDSEFLESVFATYLLRHIDDRGMNKYSSLLAAGIPREAIIDMVLTSDEYDNVQPILNDCDDILLIGDDLLFLQEAFRRILKREIDEVGQEFYASQLDRGTSRAIIINALKHSDELQTTSSME
ncbi:MAG: putative SAM-dependent methyltransferase [Oceanicoccus sp.]|jgi:predicted SAM-dependent methyltransferase